MSSYPVLRGRVVEDDWNRRSPPGSFERCVPTRCPGVGWASVDSRLVAARRVAGCYRCHVLLPCVPGSGRGRRQQTRGGPARRWIPSTAHWITGKYGVGSGNHCVRDLLHVPRGVPTAKAGRKMSRHVWSRPTEYSDYLRMLEQPRLPNFVLVGELEVGRGSFVGAGNAWIVRDTENGIICLQSYSTIVSFKVGEKVIDCWSGKTRATTHHQNRFRAA